jgi:tetratricopeptide (TPR) repeat protein
MGVLTVAGGARGAAGTSRDVPASEVTATGKALFDEGVAAYDLKDYEVALQRFRAAYEVTRSPLLLFNIAQTLRRTGACIEALKTYQHFMADAPQRAESLGVRDRIGELQHECPPERSDKQPEEQVQASQEARPAPVPRPQLSLTPSSPAPSAVAPVVTAMPQRQSRSALRPWAYALLGVSVGMAALGGYEWHASNQTAERVTDLAASGTPWNQYGTALEQQGQRQREAAWLGMGLSGATLMVAATLLAWDWWLHGGTAR